MNNKDQEVLDRFHLYSQRFLQYSVAEEVYLDTLAYIKQLIEERDEARRDACNNHALVMDESDFEKVALRYAEENGWDCFQNGWSCKENNND